MPTNRALYRLASKPGTARVLQLLLDGPRSTSAIAAALHITAGTASNHLALLHAIGLVKAETQGPRRIYSARSDTD